MPQNKKLRLSAGFGSQSYRFLPHSMPCPRYRVTGYLIRLNAKNKGALGEPREDRPRDLCGWPFWQPLRLNSISTSGKCNSSHSRSHSLETKEFWQGTM